MKNKFKKFFLISLVIFLGWLNMESSVPILPLNQVKPGMAGKGKCVFSENKIEEFDVEILGIVSNPQYLNGNVILAKLNNSILEKSGVIQGMSGSPVYIDGKLIGAVAYSYSFAKEAITGITPIEEMLEILKEEPRKSSFSPQLPIKKHLTLEDLSDLYKPLNRTNSPLIIDGHTLSPIKTPLVFGGFSSKVFEKAKSFFSNSVFDPVRDNSSCQSIKDISSLDFRLKAGEPVGVQLVTGDLSLSAVGTITYVDGNKVLAFGHPFYNLGKVDYAMAKARVISIVPSLSASFMMATTGNMVGKFSQDRATGIYGELGKMPKLVPLNIKIIDSKGITENFKVKIVNDKILSPAVANLVISNLLLSEERSFGDLSLAFTGNIYLENGMSIHLEDLFSGNFDTSVLNLSSLLASVVYFLNSNEFKDLTIHRIDLEIHSSEEVKFAYLEKVWLDKYNVSPGEVIRIEVYSRTFRGESVMQKVGISAPHLPSGSEFQLIIADANSLHQLETRQYKTQVFVPRSLSQLIRILNNLRKNNRIYFRIMAAKPGLFLKGEEMPNLPPTVKSMFSSSRAATSVPTDLENSTLRVYQLPVPYVFKGMAVIPIKIK